MSKEIKAGYSLVGRSPALHGLKSFIVSSFLLQQSISKLFFKGRKYYRSLQFVFFFNLDST
jgi:hypothetical protein